MATKIGVHKSHSFCVFTCAQQDFVLGIISVDTHEKLAHSPEIFKNQTDRF